MRRIVMHSLASLLLALWTGAVPAQQPASPPANPEAEQRAAWEAAAKAVMRGPVDVALAGQAHLALPAGFAYIPVAEAGRVLRSMGNSAGSSLQGMIVPHSDEDGGGFYVLHYEAAGYVKDDDAKNWKADELLQSVREGTEEGNKRRREMGVPELEVTGWAEAPRYSADTHQLVWSIQARDKGAVQGAGDVVNYQTLVLGRDGYMAMTLVTDSEHLAALRAPTAALLDSLQFDTGKRYADFNSSTDHVAEFGLAALVAGVAAKKLGLIALIAAFAIKFAKVIALAVGAVLLALRKRLGWKKKDGAPPAPAAAAAVAVAAPAASVAPPVPPAEPAPPASGGPGSPGSAT